jgi:EAL domain-containing protein (putative c-di-GMP-specific phosphodiesterase class I)/GGDEF domain-containing protein
MSMIRQIGLIILLVVALAIGGSVAVGTWSTRSVLQQQWQLRNADSATLIALALSQHRGDMTLMRLVLSAQFDTGHYRRVRLVGPDDAELIVHESPANSGAAPAWFIAALPMSAQPGTGIVTDGWRTVGRVHVEGQSAWAYDNLWQALTRSTGWLLAIGSVALVLAAAAVSRWRRGLDDVVQQAHALEAGRFTEIEVPKTPELARVASGMNSMVRRLHEVFDAQAAQLDSLRHQVQSDPLTGLSNRRHFTAQLARALDDGARDDGASDGAAPARGGLLLLRLRELEALNARVGHAVVDRLVAAMGEVLAAYPGRVEGSFAGRLNAGDLALYLPANGMAGESAQALRATLGTALAAVEPSADVAIGGIDALTTGHMSVALSRADEALARAEFEGPFGVHVQAQPVGEAIGETEWRQRIASALDAGRVRLSEFPVLDADGRLIHMECPLRVQLQEGAAYEAAMRWLPMASRSRIVQKVDLAAADLALRAIAADRRPRCVHVSAASMADVPFVEALTRRLAAAPESAALLSLEVGESTTTPWAMWRAAAEQWRPYGTRLGIENAGGSMRTLLEARKNGLDYLKVDGRFVRGLGHDASLADYARQILTTARGIGVPVYAEGVDDNADLQRLWELGFDGATGPAVTRGAA